MLQKSLTWLTPCHSRWSIGHRQLEYIQLCPALPPPSSSSCTWNPPSTFHSRAPASMCSWSPSSSVALCCPLQCLLGNVVLEFVGILITFLWHDWWQMEDVGDKSPGIIAVLMDVKDSLETLRKLVESQLQFSLDQFELWLQDTMKVGMLNEMVGGTLVMLATTIQGSEILQ